MGRDWNLDFTKTFNSCLYWQCKNEAAIDNIEMLLADEGMV